MYLRTGKPSVRTAAALTLIFSTVTSCWSFTCRSLVGNPVLANPFAKTFEPKDNQSVPPKDRNEKLSTVEVKPGDPAVETAFGKLQLGFEVNEGQADPNVRFIARAGGHGFLLQSQGFVLTLDESKPQRKHHHNPSRLKKGEPARSFLQMRLVNSNPNPLIAGLEELPGKSNYFLGNDPQKWQTNIANYSSVRYEQIYPGIDMVYYGNQQDLEYDFVVAPGADPRAIKLSFTGADRIKLDQRGDLVLSINQRELRQHKPFVYQEIDGKKREIQSRYAVSGGNQVGILLEEYDKDKPLIIDPVLSYSTTLWSQASGLVLDASRNIYIVGKNFGNLPLVNPAQSTHGGIGEEDIYVQKLDPTGQTLLYSTFVGGNGRDNEWRADITLDDLGNAYVASDTDSTNFPTVNPKQSGYGGGSDDAVVFKLSAAGNELIYSTYLGGSLDDRGNDIAVDSSGNAYVVGVSNSANFPTLNTLQPKMLTNDVFITAFNSTGSAFIYSTWYGTNGTDFGEAIVGDPAGNVYITGTAPGTYPTTPGAVDHGSGAFITKISPIGPTVIYSAQLGGGLTARSWDIAIDSSGNAYICGETEGGLPTVNAFQQNHLGNDDGFVQKLDATGSTLVYSSYLGGGGGDSCRSIAVDLDGNAYLTGATNSASFPLVNATQSIMGGGGGLPDVFVTKVNSSGASLGFSTFLGGQHQDSGEAIVVDSDSNAYVAGWTNGVTGWPTVNPIHTGGLGFLAKYTGLKTFNITGHVTDVNSAGLSGVTITLTGSQNRTTQTNENGDYLLDSLPSGGTYTVTPSKTGLSFSPTNRTLTNLTANQTADFTTLFYSINGRVTDNLGAGLPGATLTLSGTQTGTTETDANGNYTFPNCAANGNYTITPSKISFTLAYTFTPASRSFTNLNANQTGADFTYTTSTQMAFNLLADAYVQDGTAASTNFGSVTPMLLKTTNQADQRRDVYLKFDLSILSRTIVNAKLRFYASLSAAGSVNTTAYKVADTGWSESGITWANKPVRGATLSTVAVTTTTYVAYELDVTSYVLEEKAAGRNVISLALHNPSNSTPHILVQAREAATNKPQLVLTTSDTSNAAPAVSLTAPNSGASLTAPINITVSANASDTDGTISKVDFYAGTSPLGSDTTAPYSIQWNGVTAGSYSLTAVATDNYGSSTTSSAVGISVVPANNGPAVTLTAPLGGLMFAAGSNIGLEATASDSDGTVSKVDFYAGAQLVGTDMTAPYSIVWSNAAVGAHNLTAIATDNNNNTGTSNGVSVSVVWQTGLSPTADAYVRDGSSTTTNFGTALELQTQVSTTGNNREIYLKFDITALSGIVSVKLRLNGRLLDSTGSNVPAAVYPCVNCAWTESGSGSLTWNNKPVVTGAALSAVTITDQNARWYEWDVTTYIQEEKTAGRNTVTLVLKNTGTSSPYATFNSREASSLQPQLAIVSTGVRNILLVTGSSTLNASETALKTRMENLGFTVTVKAAGSNQNSAVKTTDADGKAAVVISSTVTPANVLAKFRHVPLPVLLWEFDLLDDQGMTESSAGFFGTQTSQSALALLNTTHPMAAGLTSPVSVVSPASTLTWGKPNTNAVHIAALTSDATRIAIFGYETEAAMPGLPLPAGLPAPARRVAFFLTDTNGITLTAGGQALFDAAIKWLTAMTVTPTILSVDPILGTIGTAVTVSGYNFGDSQGASSLKFNGTNAMASSWTSTTISALVPSGASTGAVTVVVNGKTSNGITFTVNVPPLDVDGDGLADAWELQYFGNLNQGANDDPDGDTVSNLQEYLQGRNPTVSSVSDPGGAINLRLYTPLLPLSP